ncbi:MAG: hypothetical protein M0Z90_00850 [Desulfobacteraceae bacterium]|nr:hypothetical protein [Desulfobacteraceae bacterium]
MAAMKELPCWTIMNCENHTCAARLFPGRECWEVVQELEDYRAEFNVCSDCLVYVLKTGLLPLPPQYLNQLASGHHCPLARP